MSEASAEIELFVCKRSGENFIGFHRATDYEVFAAAREIEARRSALPVVVEWLAPVAVVSVAESSVPVGVDAPESRQEPLKATALSAGGASAVPTVEIDSVKLAVVPERKLSVWPAQAQQRLRDAYKRGGFKAVRAEFADRTEKSCENALYTYTDAAFRAECGAALRAASAKQSAGKPKAVVLIASVVSTALSKALPVEPKQVLAVDLARLEAALRAEAPALLAKRDGVAAQSAAIPAAPKNPWRGPRRERMDGRAPIDEDFKRSIKSARQPERATESKRCCRLCGAGAFTLPVSEAVNAERECRSQRDCQRRQERGGVAAMAALGGAIRPAQGLSMTR